MRKTVLIAAITAALMVAAQIASKAARDALFLSTFPTSALAKAMLAAAFVSLMASLAIAPALKRYGPSRVVPSLLVASGAFFALEWAFIDSAKELVVGLLFIHVASFGASVISGFWSVVNERFDPHEAKISMGRIVAGSAFGGALGGVMAERVATLLGASSTLVLLAVLNIASAIGALLIGGGGGAGEERKRPDRFSEPAPAPEITPSQRGYFISLALLSLSTATMSALIEYTLKSRAASTYLSSSDLMRLFSLLYTGAAIGSFVTQLVVGRQTLEKLGLGASLAILPGAILLTGGVAALADDLTLAAIAMVSLSVLSNSLYRAGYEILYTPVSPGQKRALKVVIDVAATRAGDAIGSGIILVIFAVSAARASALTSFAGAIVAVIGLAVIRSVHKGYVLALAESLRRGILAIEESDIKDATTRTTVANTRVDLDRERLLRDIAAHRAAEIQGEKSQGQPEDAATVRALPPMAEPRLAETVQAFLRGEPRRIRAALEAEELPPAIVAFAIPLLGEATHAERAHAALTRNIAACTGQLGDAALDSRRTLEVRAACLDVLVAGAPDRTLPVLLRALEEPLFAIQARASEVLLELRGRDLVPRWARQRVLEIAGEQLERKTLSVLSPSQSLPGAAPGRGLEEVLPGESDARLRWIFALLAIARNREAMIQAFRALASGDEHLAGTALEYLDNVLPDSTKTALLPLIAGPERLIGKTRASPEVVSELMLSATALDLGSREE